MKILQTSLEYLDSGRFSLKFLIFANEKYTRYDELRISDCKGKE